LPLSNKKNLYCIKNILPPVTLSHNTRETKCLKSFENHWNAACPCSIDRPDWVQLALTGKSEWAVLVKFCAWCKAIPDVRGMQLNYENIQGEKRVLLYWKNVPFAPFREKPGNNSGCFRSLCKVAGH